MAGVNFRIGRERNRSHVSVVADGMAAGDWAELTLTGLDPAMFIANATKTYDYCNKMGYDPVNQQVRWFGQGHLERQDWFQYDFESSEFSKLTDPPWDTGGESDPGYDGHGYQHNTIDSATGDDYYRMYNSATVQALNRGTSTWGTTAAASTTGNATGGALEWMPNIGTSGGMITVLGDYVQRWTKSSDSWETITASLPSPGDYRIAHYSIPTGVMLFGGGGADSTALYSIGPTGSYTTLTDCPVDMGVTMSITACCPISGDLIVIPSNATARQYDVGGDSWSALDMTGAPSFGTVSSSSGILSAALPDHGVIMFLFCSAGEIWLYKHA